MNLIVIFFTAVSLAMDAFAVSITNGMTVTDLRPWHGIKMGLYFGAFQFIMPLIGYVLGGSLREYIEAFDHWIAFGLLVLIGGNMIRESLTGKDETVDGCTAKEALSAKIMTIQAIATSIDALAVGVSFSLLDDIDMWLSCSVIGAVAFIFGFVGAMIGKHIGGVLKDKAELAGGIVLCLIGIKILIEHLFF